MNPYWHGVLCAETLEEVGERMRALLVDQYFTLVTCNSYDENSTRFSAVDVYASQWLSSPIETKQDEYAYAGWSTPRLSMGLHTKAKTRREAHDGRPHDWTRLTFEPRKLEIELYAPAGYKLLWIFALEHHDPEDGGPS